MKARLCQPNSGGPALVRAIHHRLHELTANPEVLSAGINRDWADPLNHGPLIKDITATIRPPLSATTQYKPGLENNLESRPVVASDPGKSQGKPGPC